MFCTYCGHDNPDGANFCGQCGRPTTREAGEDTTGTLGAEDVPDVSDLHGLEKAAATGVEPSAILGELDPGTALLVSVRTPNEGARYLLDREVVTVGRHPDSDIFLDDITVSRRHAEFRRKDQRYWVHDVGSLNGTYVNGSRVDDQALSTGDEVQIGKFKLVAFVAEDSR